MDGKVGEPSSTHGQERVGQRGLKPKVGDGGGAELNPEAWECGPVGLKPRGGESGGAELNPEGREVGVRRELKGQG